MRNQARTRENRRRTTVFLLVDEIARAGCVYDADRAANAIFHYKWLWDRYDKECRRLETENEDAGSSVLTGTEVDDA